MKSLITCLTIIFLYASSVYGEIYYVAQKSNGRGDGTNFSNRMSVTNHNSSKFSPGDVIILCGGVINSVVNAPSSGASGNPITYTNDNKNPSVLKAYASSGSMRISEKKHIVIDGLDIRDGRIGISIKNSEYVTVKKCYVYNMDAKGIYGGGSSSSSKVRHLTVGGASGDGNEVYNVGTDTGGGDYAFEWAEDLIISYNKGIGDPKGKGVDGIVMTASNKVLIEYNLLKDHAAPYPVGEDGMDIKGTKNVIIRNNITTNNRCGGIKINFHKPLSLSCDTIIVYHNLSYGNDYNFNASGGDTGEAHSNIFAWGNIFHSARSGNVVGLTSQGRNFHFYNNTVFGFTSGKSALYLNRGSNYYIKNNIFGGQDSNRMIWANVSFSVVTVDNNLYFNPNEKSTIYRNGSWISAVNVDTKGKDVDPKFANFKNHNFRLNNGSPALNSGLSISGSPPSITVFGKKYSFSYADILDPTTDWSVFPPAVKKVNQNDNNEGWVKGAYGNQSSIQVHAPRNIVVGPKATL